MKLSILLGFCMGFIVFEAKASGPTCETLRQEPHLTLLLKGRELKSLNDVHDQVRESQMAPAHYGDNLDALFDVLTHQDQPLIIEFHDVQLARVQLSDDFDRLWSTLNEATEAGASDFPVCLDIQ